MFEYHLAEDNLSLGNEGTRPGKDGGAAARSGPLGSPRHKQGGQTASRQAADKLGCWGTPSLLLANDIQFSLLNINGTFIMCEPQYPAVPESEQ